MNWFLGEAKVCFRNFCHLLGVAEKTIREDIGNPGRSECRMQRGPVAQTGPQTCITDFFFQEMYQSAAESLPNAGCQGVKASETPSDPDATYLDKPWLDKDDPLTGDLDNAWLPDRPAVDLSRALTLAANGIDMGLPVRFLGHTNLHSLYWCFLAHWSVLESQGVTGSGPGRRGRVGPGDGCPSYSTFRRRWFSVWCHYMCFRKSSQHAQCNTCWKLDQLIRDPKSSLAVKWKAGQELRQHYRATYLDRQIYWTLRLSSRLQPSTVLVIIIDSMDRALQLVDAWAWCLDAKQSTLQHELVQPSAESRHQGCCSDHTRQNSPGLGGRGRSGHMTSQIFKDPVCVSQHHGPMGFAAICTWPMRNGCPLSCCLCCICQNIAQGCRLDLDFSKCMQAQ